jgi:hypothetical protein
MPDKGRAFDRFTTGGTKWRQRQIEHVAQCQMGRAGDTLEWSRENNAVGQHGGATLPISTTIVIGPAWRHMLWNMRQ